MTNRNC